ncbi:MAG: 6,7-dimethyl-8-ribityllumazine synthase [Gammaproteobacteria bacterium]
MSKQNVIEGDQTINNARIGIVASKFNSFVVDRLLSACLETLEAAGLNEKDLEVVRVPGAFEIPVAAQHLIRKKKCEAVIALGAIIRGETSHFEYIANECSRGLSQVAIDNDVPVIFGVLTADNSDQAMDRAGPEESNKGAEAAKAAIEMISLLRKIG